MSLDIATRTILVDIVRQAARAEILPRFRNLAAGDVAEKTSAQDLVTEADTAAEEMMTALIREALPQATVIGEEAVADDPTLLRHIAEAEFCVILDPIDGTWNYAKGISTYGVILAVTQRGETVFGLLYDPSCDDWVWAAKGQGAWQSFANGRTERLGVTVRDGFENGFVPFNLFAPGHQARLGSMIPQFGRAYSLRCSCHEYRTLAAGHVDFGINAHLKPWDHAAGALIYQEAGGEARLLDGQPYRPTLLEGRLLLAPSAPQWAELQSLFAFLEEPAE